MANEKKVPKKSAKRVRFSDEVECRRIVAGSTKSILVVNTDDREASSSTASVNTTKTLPSPSTATLIYERFAKQRVRLYEAEKRKKAVFNYIMQHDPIVLVRKPVQPNAEIAVKSKDQDKAECDSSQMPPPVIMENKEPDVVGLINETRQMAISSLSVESVNEFAALQDHQYASPSGSSSEKNNLENPILRKHVLIKRNHVFGYSKRALKGLLSEKQTAKLNRSLKKKNLEFASADELKAAVYEAWNEVKNNKSFLGRIFVENFKRRSTVKLHKHKKYIFKPASVEKKSSKKCMKCRHKITSEQAPQQSKSKEDLEESKMAFQAWKKKKDEILRQKMAEKGRMEEKEKSDSLVNERIRKNDAESAFSAWNVHKSDTLKAERRKKQWLLEREKEMLRLKMDINDESEKVYLEWLGSKVYCTSDNARNVNEEKPPWTPPGKTNSLI